MKKYKSKIGSGIILFITIVLGGTSVIMFFNQIWIGLAIILTVALFVTYIFSSISYTIDGNRLIVRNGFMYNSTIPIDKIKKIVETNNPFSAPAGSLDRIAIYYNTRDSVLVSPKDKMGFIHQLKEINSSIKVVLRKEGNQK